MQSFQSPPTPKPFSIAEPVQVTLKPHDKGFDVTVCWHNAFNGEHMQDTTAFAVTAEDIGSAVTSLLRAGVPTS